MLLRDVSRFSRFLGAVGMAAILNGMSANAANKTFVYCSEGSPSKMNAQVAEDGTTSNVTIQMYNNLVQFKLGKTTTEPVLAESYKISKDGLHYTFKLRKDVKFHTTKYFKPTRNFNADDVIYSFKRQSDKNHPLHSVGGAVYVYFESMEMTSLIQDIKKIDDYTVEFVLSRQEAPFLADIAMPFGSIISAEYGEMLAKAGKGEKIDYEPIGTGPYRFVRYDKDQMVRMEANPDYFLGRPKIDQLIYSITPDASVRTQKLRTGECQMIADPAPADMPEMRKDPKLSVVEMEGMNVMYLAMNITKKPYDNKLVRQAFNHALNKKAYLNAIYLGSGEVAINPLPPTLWSYNKSIKDFDYNPEKAKALLAKAGFPNGFETEMWTMPVSRPYNPNGKKMGEMMQADLAKVGIKVKLLTFDWPTYLKKSRQGEHYLIQMGWNGDNGDPDNFLNVLLGCAAVKSGQNLSLWCNPEFEKLVTQARQTPNQAKRTELYKKAQVIAKEEAPWVPIAHSKIFRVMSKKVKGYVMDPFNFEHFGTVDLQ